jgi:hypothetical protein
MERKKEGRKRETRKEWRMEEKEEGANVRTQESKKEGWKERRRVKRKQGRRE